MVETVINYEYSVKNLFSPHNSAKNCQKENKARKEWTSTNIYRTKGVGTPHWTERMPPQSPSPRFALKSHKHIYDSWFKVD